MDFTEKKAIKSIRQVVAGNGKLGDVEVKVNLHTFRVIYPGSTIPLDVIINNYSKSNVVGACVRFVEVQSWRSIYTSRFGNNPELTEVKNLAQRNVANELQNASDYPEEAKEKLVARDVELQIPTSAREDREVGLVTVHHILEVTVKTGGPFVTNVSYRFPLVIGGEQPDSVPDEHHLHYIRKKGPSDVIADFVAQAIKLVVG